MIYNLIKCNNRANLRSPNSKYNYLQIARIAPLGITKTYKSCNCEQMDHEYTKGANPLKLDLPNRYGKTPSYPPCLITVRANTLPTSNK